jgi:hypothetical protein
MSKLYKSTNLLEHHGDMWYRDGLNEDVVPISIGYDGFDYDPSKCGGITFSSEDTFHFLKKWVREVTIPDGEPYYISTKSPDSFKAHRVILGERKCWGDLEVFKSLLDDGVELNNSCGFIMASVIYHDYLELFQWLMNDGRINPGCFNNLAVRQAASYGRIEYLKILLEDPRVNPCDAPKYPYETNLLLAIGRAYEYAKLYGNFGCFYLLRDYYIKNGLTIPEAVK